MSKNFDQEIDSLISQLQPIRLEVLQAEPHFREELVGCIWLIFKAHEISSITWAYVGTTFANCRKTLGGLRSVRLAVWNPT